MPEIRRATRSNFVTGSSGGTRGAAAARIGHTTRLRSVAAVVGAALLLAACSTALEGDPVITTGAQSPDNQTGTEQDRTSTETEPGAGSDTQTAPLETESGSQPEPEPDADPRPDGAPLDWVLISDGALIDADPLLTGVGDVIVPIRSPYGSEGDLLLGFQLPVDDEAGTLSRPMDTLWQVEYSSACGFDVMPGGMAAAPLLNPDGEPVIQLGYSGSDLLDRSNVVLYDNPAIIAQPGRQTDCSAVALTRVESSVVLAGASVDDDRVPLIFWAGPDAFADGPESAVFETLPAPNLVAGPVSAADGNLWTVHAVNGSLIAATVQDLVESGGDPEPIGVALPGERVGSPQLTVTQDGFITFVGGGDLAEPVLLRVGNDGVQWQLPLPVTVDDTEYGTDGSQPIAANDQIVATYVSGDAVLALDAGTGDVLGLVRPSSFENNGKQVAVHADQVVVGPFGGDAWVEAYDARTGEPVWQAYTPQDVEVNDAKRLTSLGEDGVLVQATGPEGVLIAIIHPEA